MKKLVTKTQIKAVYDFCKSQNSFDPNHCNDVFDDTDYEILEILNDVRAEYFRISEIVEEVYLRINEHIFKKDLTYYLK